MATLMEPAIKVRARRTTAMTEPTPSIVIVGGEALVAEGLRQLLQSHGLPVLEGADGPAALLRRLQASREEPPRLVILLDFPEPDSQATAAIRELLQLHPELRLVLLVADLTPDQLARALELGVRAALLRNVSTEALLHAISLVMLDETVLPTRLAAEIMNRDDRGAAVTPRGIPAGERLSARDVEILQCLVRGLPNKSIARRLGLQEGTVKVHVRQLLRKIGAENRTQAAIWALGHGFSGTDGTTASGETTGEPEPKA